MQTRSKEKPDKTISYAEVSSDVEMDLGEEKPKIKSRGSSGRKRKGVRGKYASRLLLDLPFDEFEVLCRHLDGEDLARLVRVNKQLRQDLAENSLLWKEAREREGYLLPEGISEFKFGMVLWSNRCLECGSSVNLERDMYLRTCLCSKCRVVLLAKGSKVFNDGGINYHPRIRECVLLSYKSATIEDLENFSNILFELDQKDSLDRKKTSSSSSRGNGNVPSRVEAYLAYRLAHVQYHYQVAAYNRELYRSLYREKWEASALYRNRRAREDLIRSRRREAEEKRAKLISLYGWSQTETWYCEDDWLLACDFDSENADEVLSQKRVEIAEQREVKRQRDAKTQRRIERRKNIAPYYDALRAETSAADGHDIFPDLREVGELPDVKALYEPEDSLLNNETWNNAKPAILELVDRYREQHRVETIHRILYANSSFGGILRNFPKTDYPAETYDESFFSLATSALSRSVGASWGISGTCVGVWSYPAICRFCADSDDMHTDRAQVRGIRLLLHSADLNHKVATVRDLHQKSNGGYWLWINRPNGGDRLERFKLLSFMTEIGGLSLTDLGKVKLQYHSDSS